MSGLADVLAGAQVRSVFQPIVHLDTGAVVAYEALARGPEGPLARPDALFAAARAEGRLAELDEACRAAAFRGALEQGLLAPLTLFVNVEPEVLDNAPLDDLLAIVESAPGPMQVVLEITERALAARPADLLRTVERVRSLGWGVALDDVGAEALSLAFMPLLRPDVVKLDLSLVQQRPGSAVAEIMNAVNAYAEASGALVLAEGIEDEGHLRTARALGATLGQGWLFGRPAAGPATAYPVGALSLAPACAEGDAAPSPFACLPDGVVLRRSPKALLIELSKQLEREALRLGESCVVAATFQEARHFTPATRQRYRDLEQRVGFVCAVGEGLPVEPVPGVRGATLSPDDPVRGEWDIAVVGPHFAAALLARDLGDTGPDRDRMFEYALTYRRDTVVRATNALLARVVPRLPAVEHPSRPGPVAAPPAPDAGAQTTTAGEALLQRALSATTSGVSIADLGRPDTPLIYVNAAFEQLSGYRQDEVLGRNCRFLQGVDTDVAAVNRIRAAVAEGREHRETLLNYRGDERTPWWNEVYLAPVRDGQGVVRQYIGVQNDVTARVEAERALQRERDRVQGYLSRIERLAHTDDLTGLPNRRSVQRGAEEALAQARADGGGVALLFLDVDGFKAVNDALGHGAGDAVLQAVGQRLRDVVGPRDLVARLSGDEFLVVLPGLYRPGVRATAEQVARELAASVALPVVTPDGTVQVSASIGSSAFPDDGSEFGALLRVADARMYARKHPERALLEA